MLDISVIQPFFHDEDAVIISCSHRICQRTSIIQVSVELFRPDVRCVISIRLFLNQHIFILMSGTVKFRKTVDPHMTPCRRVRLFRHTDPDIFTALIGRKIRDPPAVFGHFKCQVSISRYHICNRCSAVETIQAEFQGCARGWISLPVLDNIVVDRILDPVYDHRSVFRIGSTCSLTDRLICHLAAILSEGKRSVFRAFRIFDLPSDSILGDLPLHKAVLQLISVNIIFRHGSASASGDIDRIETVQ